MKINHFTTTFFCLQFIVNVINSQSSENSLLWEINGKGLEKPSYVYGTIHSICAKDMRKSEVIKQKFDESDKICFELDLDDPTLALKTMQMLQMPTDKKWTDFLSRRKYRRLSKFFNQKLNQPIEIAEKFKPFFAFNHVFKYIMGCDFTGSEIEMMQWATKSKKEIIGIESPEEQMKAISSFSLEKQFEMLWEMYRNQNKVKRDLEKLSKAYASGDLNKIYESMKNVDYTLTPEAYDALLVNRNKNWIPIMRDMMTKGSIFFAVGAGHLPGKDGILELLKNEGFTVTSIPLN